MKTEIIDTIEKLELFKDTDIGRLYASALDCDLPIISKEKCCQILAWVYIFGGGNEDVCMNKNFGSAIRYSQYRLNILGGEMIDIDYIETLQEYIREAEQYSKKLGNDNKPEWISDIEGRYQVTTRI
ncbi:MAG: hypothetical protein FWG20_02175 [Candidatus Cloacimonetes bacterium]|nr:hypothetical protein [Candidatus Cloacimonadota bacterium]